MNTRTSSRRGPINRIQISRIFMFLLLALVLGGSGFCYVSLKYTQHELGEQVREAERQLRETRARNQDFQSRIARLSSPMTLRQELEKGQLAMVSIQDHAIARLLPPVPATDDGIMRTAANQSLRP